MKRNKLREKRKGRGLTQNEVAEMAGICRGYYSNIENGKKRCSFNTWLRIAESLDIPEKELVSYIKEGIERR